MGLHQLPEHFARDLLSGRALSRRKLATGIPKQQTSFTRIFGLSAIFFIASASSIFALDPTMHISQYGHSAWRLQDAILPGMPTAITQTKDGYIWVGTQNGLLSFDGVRFVPWKPPAGRQLPYSSSAITSLLGARDRSLWIGTNTGLSHWKSGELTNYPGSVAYIGSIMEDRRGTIWVTRSRISDWTGPLCRIVGDELRCYGTKDGIASSAADAMFEDSEGYLWIGATGALIKWKEKLVGVYPLKGTSASDALRIITGVVLTQNNTLLAGMANVAPEPGLQQLQETRWKPFVKRGLNGSMLEVTTMFLDRDQSIWIGTTNQGTYRIHGEVVDHFSRADGLSADTIQGFFQDREGDIWIATTDGLDFFHDLRIANFTVREGLTSGLVRPVVSRRDGSVWSGNQGGLDFLPTGETSFSSIRKNLPGRQVYALLEDHAGNLWVGVDHGIYVYNGGRFVPVLNSTRTADKARFVLSFAEDSKENVWAVISGPNPALLRIHDLQVREEFPPSKVPAAFGVAPDPQGGIWVSLLNGELAHYHQGAWQRIPLDPMRAGIPRQRLFNIFVDPEGTVWGAGRGGVAAYRDGEFKLLTEKSGLPCTFSYSLIMDLHRALWVYSQCGLTRIAASELRKFLEHPESQIHVEHFGRLDGARPGAAGHPGVARSLDGRLWFANGVALQMIDPDHFVTNSDAPPVHIEQLVADHKDYQLPNHVALPALTRDIEIDYTALSFVMPQRVAFRYILEGRDTNWQDPGARRQVFYSDLRPGSYRFRVIASNNDGVWNEQGANLEFKIAPAFYQTRWFVALCFATAGVALYLIFQMRLRQVAQLVRGRLEERLAERERIARDLHDTLLQSVQGLTLKFDAGVRQIARENPARQTLERALDYADQVLAEGRDRVRNLRSSAPALIDLPGAFRRIADEMSRGEGTSFKTIVEGNARALHPMVLEESYSIGREALINALTHSNGRNVEAKIIYDSHEFRLRIRDDGKGIDPAILEKGRPEHWGLRGMRERAQTMGAELHLRSRPEAGTEIELKVPATRAYRSASG